MGSQPLSFADVAVSGPAPDGAPTGRIRLAARGWDSAPRPAPGTPIADLFYGEVRLLTLAAPAEGVEEAVAALPFPGGPVDPDLFRLVGRPGREAVQGRVSVERVPATPLEEGVERQAGRIVDQDEEPRVAGAAVVAAAVVAFVAVALYFVYRAVKAVTELANRGGGALPIEGGLGEEAREAVRALDPGASAEELIAARRRLVGGRAPAG